MVNLQDSPFHGALFWVGNIMTTEKSPKKTTSPSPKNNLTTEDSFTKWKPSDQGHAQNPEENPRGILAEIHFNCF